MFRLILSIMMIFPTLAPRTIKFVRGIYRLHFDSRVNIILKFLVPAAIIYVVSPLDLIRDWKPFGLGHADDIIILGIAVWLFWILCPLAAVREHMGEPPPPRPEDRDPDGVVDGQARPPDDND